jgi:hypothetical protein
LYRNWEGTDIYAIPETMHKLYIKRIYKIENYDTKQENRHTKNITKTQVEELEKYQRKANKNDTT